jgi:hypothetical protein
MTLHTPHGLEGDHNNHVATTQPEAPAKKNGRGRVIGAIGTTVALLVGGGTALMSAEKGGHKAPAVAASPSTAPSAIPSVEVTPVQSSPAETSTAVAASTASSVTLSPTVKAATNPNGYSAGTLDPRTPTPVPYVPGQAITVTDVEKLIHNIDVATTTDDLSILADSGIPPTSEFATNIKTHEIAHMQEEQASAAALVHSFQKRLSDKDVLIHARPAGQEGTYVQAMVAGGTDFDRVSAPSRISYQELDMTIGHKVMQLANGQSEDILTINTIGENPSTSSAWDLGFPPAAS